MKTKQIKQRKDLFGFIQSQIVEHNLAKKSDRIWAEIAQTAATFKNIPFERVAYRVLHEHCRRCHHIIPDALAYRQRLHECYTRHPENRVYSNKELLKHTSWWRKAYETKNTSRSR